MAGGIGFEHLPFHQSHQGLVDPIRVIAEAPFACRASADLAPGNKLFRPLFQVVANILFVRIHGRNMTARALRVDENSAN